MPKWRERGLVSFPKAGRTWVRLFLEYYQRFTGLGPRAVVVFHHDDRIDFKRRAVLMRHPCDVMVSFHIHRWVRRRARRLSISAFIRSQRYGVPAYNQWYAAWSQREENQHVVRYEDLFQAQAWRDLLAFFDIPLYEEAFRRAIDKTRFDTIRRNLAGEIKDFPSAWRYLAAEHGNYNLVEPQDPEAHKFRRGKVGGYVDYLDREDIEYILDNFRLGERWEAYRQQYLVESAEHCA